ncbi:MAG: hypothetical protein KDB27_00875, partial [Planctomycetales bacterium]|nr:hypothetical protein [Planctomycetales bacterium]
MPNHQRYSHRSTLFVVLLLMGMALQVPDLWWRNVARTSDARPFSNDTGTTSVVSLGPTSSHVARRTEMLAELRSNHRRHVADRFVQQKRTVIDCLSRPTQTTIVRQTFSPLPTIPATRSQSAETPAPSDGVSKFRLASFATSTDESEVGESDTSRERKQDANKEARIAAKRPTQGEDHSSAVQKQDGADANQSQGDSTASTLDGLVVPPQKPLDPLDVPDQNLLELDPAIEDSAACDLKLQVPVALFNQFDELRELHCNQQVAGWIDACVSKLQELAIVGLDDSEESAELVEELTKLSGVDEAVLPNTGSLVDDASVRQVAYSLERRCLLWNGVRQILLTNAHTENGQPVHASPDSSVADAVDAVSTLLQSESDNHQSWRDYLQLSTIRTAAEAAHSHADVRRQVAQNVLKRMNSVELTEDQERFLQSDSIQTLKRHLDCWAVEPFDSRYFLASIENFEAVPSDKTAAALLEQVRNLYRFPADAKGETPHANLAETVTLHYRNANVRVSVSGQLMNQMLPVIRPIEESVSDNFLGASVSGKNQTWTKLEVQLVPDENRINLKLNAEGTTESETISRKGPVRLFSRGNGWFRAGIPIFMNKRGVRTSAPSADASGGDELVDVRTDYDRVPLLGWVVRQLAIGEHQDNRGLVNSHVKEKMAETAKSRLNKVVQERLDNSRQFMRDKIIDPLETIDVDFKAIEMRTAEDRVTVRCRLAGPHQMAAFTARPRAVAGSAISMQL